MASSSLRSLIDTVLASAQWTRLSDVTVSTEEVGHGKPAPDVYLNALNRLNTAPECAVAVEDSTNEPRSASATGLRVIAIPRPAYPPVAAALADADLILSNPADLGALALESLTTPSQDTQRRHHPKASFVKEGCTCPAAALSCERSPAAPRRGPAHDRRLDLRLQLEVSAVDDGEREGAQDVGGQRDAVGHELGPQILGDLLESLRAVLPHLVLGALEDDCQAAVVLARFAHRLHSRTESVSTTPAFTHHHTQRQTRSGHGRCMRRRPHRWPCPPCSTKESTLDGCGPPSARGAATGPAGVEWPSTWLSFDDTES